MMVYFYSKTINGNVIEEENLRKSYMMQIPFQTWFASDAYITSFAMDTAHAFILSQNRLYCVDKSSSQIVGQTSLFTQPGKARELIVDNDWLYVRDFCDLYIIDKTSLEVVQKLVLGSDLSSDICAMQSDADALYLSMRNGSMIRLLKQSPFVIKRYPVSTTSIWDFVLNDHYIFAGNVGGELLVIDKQAMQIQQSISSGKQNLKSVLFTDRYLFTASQNKQLLIRDRTSLEISQSIRNAHKRMFELSKADAETVFTISHPCGEIKCWDVASGQCQETYTFPRGLSGETHWEGSRLYLISRNIKGLVYYDWPQ